MIQNNMVRERPISDSELILSNLVRLISIEYEPVN